MNKKKYYKYYMYVYKSFSESHILTIFYFRETVLVQFQENESQNSWIKGKCIMIADNSNWDDNKPALFS